MAEPTYPPTSKLIMGVMYRDTGMLEKAKKILAERFGPVELQGTEFDFSFTDYYEQEFGAGLKKVFLSFLHPFSIESLPDVKICTNLIEKQLSSGKREINIDPGYATVDALVLATCKPRPYRIYLSKGIYAHLNFLFRKNDVVAFSWTFQDYISQKGFFMKVRDSLKKNI